MVFLLIMITSFRIFNKPFTSAAMDGDTSLLQKDISDIKALSLSHKQTFFSIEYAALDFSSGRQKEIRFYARGI